MIIKDVLLYEAEEKIGEFEKFASELEVNSSFNSDDSKVFKSDAYYLIYEIGVKIHEAVCCNYNEETDAYDPDFDLYIFYDLNNSNIIYEEGASTLISAVSNFNNILDKNYVVGNLKCDLVSE